MSKRVATRYGKSLFDLAKQAGTTEQVYSEMQDIQQTINGSAELTDLLKSPIVSSNDKWKVLSAIFKNSSSVVKDFMQMVVSRKREDLLAEMAGDYQTRYRDANGMASAVVRSAIELNEEVLDNVKRYLRSMIGKEEIELTNVIDSSVIGGMVVQYEDKVLDLSVARELREIRKQIIINN